MSNALDRIPRGINPHPSLSVRPREGSQILHRLELETKYTGASPTSQLIFISWTLIHVHE